MGHQAAEMAGVGVGFVHMHGGVVAGQVGVGQDAGLGDGVLGADAFIAHLCIVPVFFNDGHGRQLTNAG
ncbi:hypothetical protein D3C72_2060350 [compost metagenome]